MGGKTPVILRDDYTAYLELYKNQLWFHVDVRRWSPQVKRQCSEDITKLLDLVNRPLLALIVEDNIKLMKFAKAFKWKQMTTLPTKDGRTAFVYVSPNKLGV